MDQSIAGIAVVVCGWIRYEKMGKERDLRGYIFQKLLLACFFPSKNKICVFIKETDTFGHIVV